MAPKSFAVKIGHDEMGRILNLKESVDHTDRMQRYATRYQRLGWALVGVAAGEGGDPELDFSQPPEVWSPRLTDLVLAGFQVNVGVRTGKASQLLVLEVNKGEGALALEQLGEWRAACIAEVGGCREQHYYALPADGPWPPSFFQAPQALIYGEGGVVMVPPSLEPQAHAPWRWLQPPWEQPPRYPQLSVWQFLENYLPPAPPDPPVPPWEEIYRVISPYNGMLKALLVPAANSEAYYLGLLQTALRTGLRDAKLLLGLLWHAPHGEARHRLEKWDYLRELVAKAQQYPDESRAIGSPETSAAAATLGKWLFPEKAMNDSGLPAAIRNLPLAIPGDPAHTLSGEREDAGTASPAGRFDYSVSGQFFQLLAGLGERVISETCRYEAMRSGAAVPGDDPARLQAEWRLRHCPPAAGPPGAEAGGQGKAATDAYEISQVWAAALKQQTPQQQQLAEIQNASHEFLSANPDLAADRQKVLMVLFCLKNYVSINPELAALPFKKKLEEAGRMARVFLGEQEGY